MFTGIVEERGQVLEVKRELEHMQLTILCQKVLEEAQSGESIAVNGVCLTITSFTESSFTADIMPETFRCTQLGELTKGSMVNLERALVYGGRVNGHLVQGHVDIVGRIVSKRQEQNAVLLEVSFEPSWNRYLIKKGSIAMNGISLTLVDVFPDCFIVSIIPHTLQMTNLEVVQEGDLVNLEFDIMAKYLEKWNRMTEGIR